tara:strand:+ start:656 stop:1162 length:507 start_codon:yes stop_codon:yes gene_type:complete
MQNNDNKGKKYDNGKVKVELLYKDLVSELEGVARVLTFGAAKYDARNWMNLDNGKERYLAAALRHINAYMKGELIDPESGEAHLSHAITCLLFISHLENTEAEDLLGLNQSIKATSGVHPMRLDLSAGACNVARVDAKLNCFTKPELERIRQQNAISFKNKQRGALDG